MNAAAAKKAGGVSDFLHWIKCDKCVRWEIYENSGLQDTLGAFDADKVDSAKFTCGYCYLNDKLNLILTENEELRRKVQELESVKKEVDNVKTDVKKAVQGEVTKERTELKNELLGIMDEKVSEYHSNSVGDGSGKSVAELVSAEVSRNTEESRERDRRKCNIIIFKVDETEASNSDHGEIDKQFVSGLIEGPLGLAQSQDQVLKVTRLGKSSDSRNARPILVKLSSNEFKTKIMSSLKKLKHAEEKYKKISISHDLTVNQREAVKNALAKAREEHQDQSQQGNWVLRVVNHQSIPKILRVKLS